MTYGTSAREESVTEFGGFLGKPSRDSSWKQQDAHVLKASKKEYHRTEVKQAIKAAMMHLEFLCEMSEVQSFVRIISFMNITSPRHHGK